jgi:hypothetical protein
MYYYDGDTSRVDVRKRMSTMVLLAVFSDCCPGMRHSLNFKNVYHRY